MDTPCTLITGGNRGLGLALVRKRLADGHRVLAGCRRPGHADALNRLAAEFPGHLHVLPLDLERDASIREFAREIPLLGWRIGVLVNNAGVLVTGEHFGALRRDDLLHCFQTNAAGPLLLAQELAPLMVDGARIVNISSDLASMALTAHFDTPSYSLSKAALNMSTVLLQQALHPQGIVVVSLHPGWVRTDMGGAGAQLDADEVAAELLCTVDALDVDDAGRFIDRHGKTMPW